MQFNPDFQSVIPSVVDLEFLDMEPQQLSAARDILVYLPTSTGASYGEEICEVDHRSKSRSAIPRFVLQKDRFLAPDDATRRTASNGF